MSDELIERLRWSAASTEVSEELTAYGKMMDAAADEIERLRAALQNLTTKMGAQKAVTGREFSITVEVALRSARAALSPLPAKKGGTVD